jgi:hypothetical protein
MQTNKKSIRQYQQWVNYFDTMSECLQVGNYDGADKLIKEGKSIFIEAIEKAKKDDISTQLAIAELEINLALDFNDKESFIKATEEYNKLKTK